jgi:phosphopantothenoylcysteine decarboxylase
MKSLASQNTTQLSGKAILTSTTMDIFTTGTPSEVTYLLSQILLFGMVYLTLTELILKPLARWSVSIMTSPPTPNLPPATPTLKASDHHADQKHHLLLAATGSVASIKIPQILHALSIHPNLSIRLIFSESSRQFLQNQSHEQPLLASLREINNVDGIYFDEHEWAKPWVRGDSILHIELRRWADLMVVAPLSANGLAKIATGMSDNLISSVIRAWDFNGLIDGARPGVKLPYDMGKTREELEALPVAFREGRKKGIVVAPAMNTAMWSHPVTAKHLDVLEKEWGVGNGGWFEVLRPVEKMLACGDTGSGAMRDWKEIVGVVEERLGLGHDEFVHVKKG